MNKSAAYKLFGEMRHSTFEEQQLYKEMLDNISLPLGKDIMEEKYNIYYVLNYGFAYIPS